MDCREFFKNNEGNPEKCKLLQEDPDQALKWENTSSASDHSPGRVGDEEVLHRQVFHPIHVDQETGKIKPELFDDASNKGMSVNRAKYIARQSLNEKGCAKAEQDRTRKPDRQYLGFASTACGDVRRIFSTANRAFCVFDTALADDISHADVCQIVRGKKEGRSARSKLYDLFSTIERYSSTETPA
jgi:hypothetical protein